MCDPVTMAVISIATTGYQIYSTNKAAEGAFAAQHEQAQNAIDERTSAAEEDMGIRLREMRKAKARARVAGGESGAQGQSFAVSLNQYVQDQNLDAGIVAKNVALGNRQTVNDLRAANSQVRTISGLEAGLRIASSGLGAYSAATKAATVPSSISQTLPVPGVRVS